MGPEYVAFDLETTGLDPARDAIIEIGAVRFTREGSGETFSTLVNPGRPMGQTPSLITGICDADLRDAPPLAAVAGDFERFIGDSILVGHNILGFDIPVLDACGIRHSGVAYDTQRIAAMLLPALTQYSLADLTERFEIDFPVRHRALPDAEASRRLYLSLIERAMELPTEVLSQIAQWLTPTLVPYRAFFREAWELSSARAPVRRPIVKPPEKSDARPLKPLPSPVMVPVEGPASILASAASRPDVFEDFDERAEQQRMLEAVTAAFNEGQQLMVEAGTGTGKSLAYLIPAACQAVANNSRVVISTSTINLQEQLTKKDIPALQLLSDGEVRACQLKGRRNYLCLRKFDALRHSGSLTDEEAVVASRVLVWLGETETGDRGELRLSQEEEAVWSRLSAEGADCTNDNSPFVVDGTCFLQRARRQAESAHLLVVNHSLLLSNIAAGGFVLPAYEHVIIDEAHHLEDEATRQFGFTCREKDLFEVLERSEGLIGTLQNSLRASSIVAQARQEIAGLASALREAARAAKPSARAFCDQVNAFLVQHAAPGEEQKLHVTRSTRAQPDWSDVEIAWENCRLGLAEVARKLDGLREALAKAEELGMLNQDMIVSDVGGCLEDVSAYANGLAAGIEHDDPQRIVWIEADRFDGGAMVAWVPLVVDDLLREGLYEGKRTVILTGATLRTQGNFAYLQERLGLEGCETLALGSPFDYRRCALVLVPRDMPDPSSPNYADATAQAVIDLVKASRGRALVLFTSHSMLRATHNLVSRTLQDEGINVLGQGIDGSPRQLVRMLRATPEGVILGTSSFWEGVDIPGATLSLLIMARLPFAVPTDPVFAARSALYEDSFSQYALPQAVIRFKQGFGRLIRTKTDRGVLVVLDQRIVARDYGRAFLESLPGCPIRQVMLRDMPDMIEAFLARQTQGQASPSAGLSAP